MAYPVFYVPAGDVLPVLFATYAGSTGASITATGLAVTDIEIYKDGSTTQRASDAGYTLLDTDGLDFDGLTGIHGFSIDTGDNTDAGFYTVGAWFTVVVSAITVDSQTVSFIACQFRLMAAESVAAKPKVDVDAWLGTAAATPTVAGVPEVDLTHVGGATTNVAALATNVDAILTDTGTTLDGRIPAALVGGRMDTSVGAMAANVLTASALAADAVTEIQSGLATQASVDTIDNFLDTEIAAILEDTGTTLDDFLDTEVAAILALLDDARAEPGQGAPPVNPDAMTKIDYLYKAWRNKQTQTATTWSLFADDATTVDQKSTVSDNGTTFTRGEIASGP